MRKTTREVGVYTGESTPMNELIDLSHMKRKLTVIWAGSLGVVVALVIGFFAGSFTAQGRILDDCKFNNGFRVGMQAFTCMRKI
jgi:hypothetical protein